MGQFLTTQAEPSTPPANSVNVFADSADSRRVKAKDEKGVVTILGDVVRGNMIRNSGFWFAQRQTPGTLTTITATATGRNPGPDGWAGTEANADMQYQRTDTGAAKETGLQGKYYGTLKKITSTGKMFFSQLIEGRDCQALRGRTVRLQGWLKASASKTIKMAVIQLNSAGTEDTMPATFMSALGADNVDPTLGTNLAFIAPASDKLDLATAGTNALSCAVTTSWQRFGGCFVLPADFKNLVVMIWTDTGFAANDTVSLSQVSLTDGHEIQDWQAMPYQQEMARVQRYYAKTFNIDTAPAQNVGAATGELRFTATIIAAGAERGGYWRYPVPMRAAATTITTYNPAAGNVQVRDETAGGDCTATASAAATETGVGITATGNAGTVVGGLLGVHVSADAAGANNEFV